MCFVDGANDLEWLTLEPDGLKEEKTRFRQAASRFGLAVRR